MVDKLGKRKRSASPSAEKKENSSSRYSSREHSPATSEKSSAKRVRLNEDNESQSAQSIQQQQNAEFVSSSDEVTVSEWSDAEKMKIKQSLLRLLFQLQDKQTSPVDLFIKQCSHQDLQFSVKKINHNFGMDFSKFYSAFKEYHNFIEKIIDTSKQGEESSLPHHIQSAVQSLDFPDTSVIFEITQNIIQRDYRNAILLNQPDEQQQFSKIALGFKKILSELQSANSSCQRYYTHLIEKEFSQRTQEIEDDVENFKQQKKTPTPSNEAGD